MGHVAGVRSWKITDIVHIQVKLFEKLWRRGIGGKTMADINKVKRGLECCIVRNPDDRLRCSECPYKEPNAYCLNRLKADALEVISAQLEEDTCGKDYCEIEGA